MIEQIILNGTFDSVEFRGTTIYNGNITIPPHNLTEHDLIQSISLTAKVRIITIIGKGEYTINGTLYSGNRSISMNLGTNFIDNIAVTVHGSNKNTIGRLFISDIVCTINYISLERTPPTIEIINQNTNKISNIDNFNECIVNFSSDQDLIKWEARAVLDTIVPEYGVGNIVESGENLKAGDNGHVSVLNSELLGGDGKYIISIYGMNLAGTWNT